MRRICNAIVTWLSRERRRNWWDHIEERAYRNEFGNRILFMRQGLF